MSDKSIEKIKALDCWSEAISGTHIKPLGGGITNKNFRVTDGGEAYVVRLGEDIPEHLVSRANEAAAARAAYEIGVSPEVVHTEAGVMVIRFVEGRVYAEADVREDVNLEKIVPLLKTFHSQMPARFDGFPLMFWVFQVLRHYRAVLERRASAHRERLPALMEIAARLERDTGPVDIVYGHNDLLAANFIDDGERLWLIDFDYAGFNSPLFDLANLASNNGLEPEQEHWLLARYFGSEIPPARWRSYQALKCASLLRETMWSMVSEIHSDIDFDYPAYTAENLARFETVLERYRQAFGA